MKLIESLHRWTGGFIGLLLAVLGLTGAVLVHKDAWIMLPHAGDVQVVDTRHLADVTQRIMAPATRPQSLLFASRDLGLMRLTYEGGRGAYADQNGSLVAQWDSQWKRPEIWLFDLHRHLFAGDAGETVGGVAALFGLGFVITGVLLWRRTRKSFALRLMPTRMSRPAIVRHHRDLGIVVAPLLLLSFATGAVLVFKPMTALLFGPSAPAQIERALTGPPPRNAELAEDMDWAKLIATARQRFPDAELRHLSLPRKGNGLVTIRMRRPQEWLPNGRTMLWFADDTGALIAVQDATRLPSAVQGQGLLYPLHAAKVGGLAFRLLMTVSGLALTLLGTLAVWTFWFKRASAPAQRKSSGFARADG